MIEIESHIKIGDATKMSAVQGGVSSLTHVSPAYLGEHHSIKAKEKERFFLEQIFTEAARVTNNPYGFVVSYNTDFYDQGGAYPRHVAVLHAAQTSGLELYAQKYVLTKAPGKNDTFRMTIHHVQIFIHEGAKKSARTKNKRLKHYEPDVWGVFTKSQKISDFRDAVPPESVVIPIANFTEKGELIVSQCSGTGTAAIAALNMGRDAIGYEIDPRKLPLMRLREEKFDSFFSDDKILQLMHSS